MLKLIRFLLFPFSVIYWLSSFIRNKLYDWNILKSTKADLPTIVVGNFTVGGTGKTPFVIYLTNLLKDYRLAILSRGYKRKKKGCFWAEPNASFKDIGDEPKLIAHKTKLPVYLCKDRIKGIQNIRQQSNSEIVILDDGLQHRRLKPDLSIVLIDCNRLIFSDLFLPAGNLRDNIYRLKQVDIVVFTKCEDLSEDRKQYLIEKLKKYGKSEVYFTTFKYTHLYNPFSGQIYDLQDVSFYEVLAFSGIGNSEYFFKILSKFVFHLHQKKFPDHYEYKSADIKKIFSSFVKIHSKDKLIVTTEKDYMRLMDLQMPEKFKQSLYLLPIEIQFITGEKQFKQKIQSYGRKLISKSKKIS